MYIKDVKNEREAVKSAAQKRLDTVTNFADDFFGKERVNTRQRLGFANSDDPGVYIDVTEIAPFISSTIEIGVENHGIQIKVNDKGYYQEAVNFGKKYETAHKGESVELEHNLK